MDTESLVELILGKEKSDVISQQFGGQQIYISRLPSSIMKTIIELIGKYDAEKLRWHCQGTYLYIRKSSKSARNMQIRKERAGGMTLRAVADRFSITMTQVSRICKKN